MFDPFAGQPPTPEPKPMVGPDTIYPYSCPLCRGRLTHRPKAGRAARWCRKCRAVIFYERDQ